MDSHSSTPATMFFANLRRSASATATGVESASMLHVAVETAAAAFTQQQQQVGACSAAAVDRSRTVTTEAFEPRAPTPTCCGVRPAAGELSPNLKRHRELHEPVAAASAAAFAASPQPPRWETDDGDRYQKRHRLVAVGDAGSPRQQLLLHPGQGGEPTTHRGAELAAAGNGSAVAGGGHARGAANSAAGGDARDACDAGAAAIMDASDTRRHRPSGGAQGRSLLSFTEDEEAGDDNGEPGPGAAPPPRGLGAATAQRFKAEAHQQRHTFHHRPPGRRTSSPDGRERGGGGGGALRIEDHDMPRSGGGGGGRAQCAVCFGVAQARGMRPYMEDRHCVVAQLQPQDANGAVLAGHDGVPRCLAAIFDGHNGAGAAEIAASRLHVFLAQEAALRVHTGEPGPPATTRMEELAIRDALRRCFRRVDDIILGVAREQGVRDGATALVCMRLGGALYAAHAGDSRAVLCRDGVSLRLTEDHKPHLPAERARIQEAGGRVDFQRCWRVVVEPRDGRPGSGLAVSRSLGDLDFKEPARFVESEPDVMRLVLRPGDWFVVLASDGLWDVMSDEDAVAVAAAALKANTSNAPSHSDAAAKTAAEVLLAEGLRRGTMDNVTVVIMLLSWGDAGGEAHGGGQAAEVHGTAAALCTTQSWAAMAAGAVFDAPGSNGSWGGV